MVLLQDINSLKITRQTQEHKLSHYLNAWRMNGKTLGWMALILDASSRNYSMGNNLWTYSRVGAVKTCHIVGTVGVGYDNAVISPSFRIINSL